MKGAQDEKKVAKEAEERKLPPVHVVFETIRLEGEHEISRAPIALWFSGLAAGLSMGFSLIVSGLLRAHLPDAPWRPLVQNFGYTTGFLIVIMGRQQLFTENTLTPILPLLRDPSVKLVGKVLRLWLVVLFANVIGCALVAYLIVQTGTFTHEVHEAFAQLAAQAYDGSFWSIFWRAFFGGWLIALMVWLIPASEGGASVAVVLILTYVVGIGRFSHVIAGSVDSLYSVFTGDRTGMQFLLQFFVPTLCGNVIGGVLLVSLLGFAQVKPDQKET